MTFSLEDVIAVRERKNNKEQQLIRLLRDPDVQGFVEDLLAALRNGSANKTRPSGRGRFVKGSRKPAGLRSAIRKLYDVLSRNFSYPDVLQLLKDQSFAFTGGDETNSVRNQLYALEKMGELKLVRPGKAGVPNVYEVAKPRFPRTVQNDVKIDT